MNCSNSVEMIQGEKRWLECKVSTCGTTPQYFSILSATYEFAKLYVDDVVITGDCIVDNDAKTIKCLIHATEKGNFAIAFTWTIAEEIFKEKVRVDIC